MVAPRMTVSRYSFGARNRPAHPGRAGRAVLEMSRFHGRPSITMRREGRAGDRHRSTRLDVRTKTGPITDGLAAPRRYWAWTAILLAIVLSVLDGSIANVALPTIASEFEADPSVAIWIVNGYQLAIVVSLLPFSALGEIYGYRNIYLAGVAIFTCASIACVLSSSLGALTAARIIQGLGAAGVMSVNTALLRYTVSGRAFGMALGFNAIAVASAATVGPTIAGFILTWASWPWLFAINIPLGVVAIVLGWASLPDSDRTGRRFDWQSALLIALTFGLFILFIDSVGHSLPAALIAGQGAALLLFGTLLARRGLSQADPMLPLDLLRQPIFSLSIATSITSFMAQMLAFVSLPFMLQTTMGFSPRDVGLLMMPWPLALGIVAPISGYLADRRSPALLGGIGLVTMAAGLALLALLPADASAADIVWRMAVCGIGFGLFQTPNNRTMIGAAPKRRSGAASGMLGTARLTGQTTGAALVGLLLGHLGIPGATWALALGACFAALAACLSLSRSGLFREAERKAAEEAARRDEDMSQFP